MRNIFLLIAFSLFFSFTVSSQYTWQQKGVKTLVGKERKYFGTETRPEELKKIACGCEPHADYSGQDKKNLGNLSPDMGESGKGLFWNFDKQGRAHLTELEGSDQVFLKGPCPYVVACGNLLKEEELETKSPAPEKNLRKEQPAPEKRELDTPVSKPEPPVKERMVMIQKYQIFYFQKLSYGCPQSIEQGDKRKLGEPFLIYESELEYYLNKRYIVHQTPTKWYEASYQEVAMNEYPYVHR